MHDFKQHDKVKAKVFNNGREEEIFGKVDSVTNEGIWITWDTDFSFAHRNIYVPNGIELYNKLELVKDVS